MMLPVLGRSLSALLHVGAHELFGVVLQQAVDLVQEVVGAGDVELFGAGAAGWLREIVLIVVAATAGEPPEKKLDS